MANEKRLIDANFTKKTIKNYIANNEVTEAFVEIAGHICDMLDDCETVDAVEVVHGYNIDRDTPSLFECSVCHWSCWDTYCGDTDDYNYCPNCGAKMMDL